MGSQAKVGARRTLALALALQAAAAGCGPSMSLAPVGQAGAAPSNARPTSELHLGTGGSTKLPAKEALQLLVGQVATIVRPQVQLIASEGDSRRAGLLQPFLADWFAHDAFAAQVGEYGVAQATALPWQQTPYAWPAAAIDGEATGGQPSDIAALLADFWALRDRGGAPDDAVAVVLVPATSKIALVGRAATDACAEGVLAWHGATLLPGNSRPLPYVVLPDCPPLPGLSRDETASVALSHALVGALTNPQPGGYGAVDSSQAVWQRVLGEVEAPSLCQLSLFGSKSLIARPAGLALPVHRSWSNARALAGQSPCVPEVGTELYTMARPQNLQPLALVEPTGALGLLIAAGQTTSVPVKLLASDGLAAGIGVQAAEVGSSDLTMTWSHAGGQAGDLLALNVAIGADASLSEYVVRLTSTVDGQSFSQYLLLSVGGAP